MKEAKQILKEVFGFSEFRGEQGAVVEAALEGKNTFVLMPTGMGKSLCYQLPARALEGLTLVISPLIALMKDQVDQAEARGFRCCFINSSLDKRERLNRYKKLSQGEYELVYVTPERFQKKDFREAIAGQKVSLLAVDEAHCVSQWGHDFRPDYSRINEFREFLSFPVTMALTATATPEVQEDILLQLGLTRDETQIFYGGLERPNLFVEVEDVHGTDGKVRAIVGKRQHIPGPMIVYCSLISTLEKLSEKLDQLSLNHIVYHGQMEPRRRKRNQELFLNGEVELILATPAFGLGVDKRDVRCVVHAEIPNSIEAYYQEIGRAGRDGESSECILLYDKDDLSIQMDFMKWANPDGGFISTVYRLIKDNPDRVKAQGHDYLRGQLNFYNRRDFRLETSINLLKRWGCLQGDGPRDWKIIGDLDPSYIDSEAIAQRLKMQQTKLYELLQLVQLPECRKKTIYNYFGLKDVEDCGFCDRCREREDGKKIDE